MEGGCEECGAPDSCITINADGPARARGVTYRFPATLSLLRLRRILSQGFGLGIRRGHCRADRTVGDGFGLGHDGVHDRVILLGMGGLDHRDHWNSFPR